MSNAVRQRSFGLPQQDAIKIFGFEDGVCVEQENSNGDSNSSLWIGNNGLLLFICELLSAAGMEDVGLFRKSADGSFDDLSDIDLQRADVAKPKDPTAAARMRRCREKRRNSCNSSGATAVTIDQTDE